MLSQEAAAAGQEDGTRAHEFDIRLVTPASAKGTGAHRSGSSSSGVSEGLVSPLLFTSPFEHPSEKTLANQDESHIPIPSEEHSNPHQERKPRTTE